MSFNLENALALLKPHEQAAIFAHLAEQLHQSGLVALAQCYQRLLEEKSCTTPDTAVLKESYRTGEERLTTAENHVREEVAAYGMPTPAPPKTAQRFEEVFATFDGEVFKPEGKIDLAPDKRYCVLVEQADPEFPEFKIQAFKKIAARAIPMGIRDFAEQHDHYLYGIPKRK